MYKWILVFVQFFGFTLSYSQQLVNWDWKQIEHVNYVDMEYHGDYVYAVGNFTSPSVEVGGNTFLNMGSTDFVIAKYDTLGNVVWANHYGGVGIDEISKLTVDANGNVYAVGSFTNQLTINGISYTSNGGSDIIMLKINTNGIVEFARSVGSNFDDYGIDIAADYETSIYVLANVETLTFAGKTCYRSTSLLKYNNVGNPVWHHYITGADINCCGYISRNVKGAAIKYSSIDSTIVMGVNFTGPIMTDSAYLYQGQWYGYLNFAGIDTIHSKIALAKINSLGQWQYLRVAALDAYRSNALHDLCIHPTGDIYFSQYWGMSLMGNTHGYWKKADKDCSYAITIAVLPSPVFFTSGYAGKIDLVDSVLYGIVYQQQLNAGYNCSDYYAMQYNINTNSKSFISIDEAVFALFVDIDKIGVTGKNGNFYIGHLSFMGKACGVNCAIPPLGIYPFPDVTLCSYNGSVVIGDISCFYAYGGNPTYTYSWLPTTGLSNPNIANPVVSNINTNMSYTVTATDQLNNVVYDTVEVYYNPNPIQIILNVASCDSYFYNNHTYVSNGIYIDTIQTPGFCDSVVTLNLTISHATASSITETVCDSFLYYGVWYHSSGIYTQAITNALGCDSIVTLNLTINNSINSSIFQSATDSFSLNGQTYYSSGIYTQTFINIQGCDSIITLNLTITPVGINEYSDSSFLSLYPNPTKGVFVISADNSFLDCKLKIISVHGDLILKKDIELLNNYTFDLSKYANGFYFVEVLNNGILYHFKIVKH